MAGQHSCRIKTGLFDGHIYWFIARCNVQSLAESYKFHEKPVQWIWSCYRRTEFAKLEALFFQVLVPKAPQNYKKCESLEVVTAKLLQI